MQQVWIAQFQVSVLSDSRDSLSHQKGEVMVHCGEELRSEDPANSTTKSGFKPGSSPQHCGEHCQLSLIDSLKKQVSWRVACLSAI